MTSITAERRGLDIQTRAGGPRLRRREEWNSRRAYTDSRTVVEPADHQFVHITITNPDNYSSNDAHARAVEAIGISRFPSTGISYNRGIMPNGQVYEFQPIGRRGAHTVNDKNVGRCGTSGCPTKGGYIADPRDNLNYNSRAYVFCQNVNDGVTDKQVDNIARVLAADIRAGFVKKTASLHGHRCVAWKSCPADKVWARMDDIKRLRDKYVAEGFGEEEEVVTPQEMDQIAAKAATAVWNKMFPSGDPSRPGPMRADLIIRWTQSFAYAAQRLLGDITPAPTESPSSDTNTTWYATQAALGTVLDQTYSLKSRDAEMARQLAAIQEVLKQIAQTEGTPVDWEKVEEAAERGAAEALSRVELSVTPAMLEAMNAETKKAIEPPADLVQETEHQNREEEK